MTIALITEPSEETRWLASKLSSEGITVKIALAGQPVKPIEADILVPFVNTPVTAEHIRAMRPGSLIATRSTGFDHIDLVEAKRHRVTVCNVPDYGSVSVAEYTFALMLRLTRLQSGVGTDLSGKTLGVIGTGAIGRHVIGIAHGFGMNILAYDLEHRPGIAYADTLEEVLSKADIVTLHIPATASTRHIIDAAALDRMKPGAILINTARGALVDTRALADAMRAGKLSGAGLDVIEPLDDAEATPSLPNTIITPHVAYNSQEANHRITEITLRNITAFLSGKPVNVVA